MNSINFDNVWLLFIALPLILLVAVPFFVTVNGDNRNKHNVASTILHIVIAILVAFSAAGTTIKTVMTKTNVYVVADVSYSARENLDVVDGYIAKLKNNLPSNSEIGIVCFGADQDMITRMGGEIKSVKESEVDTSSTDIVGALEYTRKFFKKNVIKRIVLITDGAQTYARDDNALRRTVDSLEKVDNIFVDAIYIDDNIKSEAQEVQVNSVECGKTVYVGQQSTATALIQSNNSVRVEVNLYEITPSTEEGGENVETKIDSKTLSLYKGLNSVNFALNLEREQGVYDYCVKVEAEIEGDSPYNNSCTFTQEVVGEVKTLFISSDLNDYATLLANGELFGENTTVDTYINTPNVPFTSNDISKYDQIVLSNVDVSTLNNYQMFVESVETAVSRLGKSLITIGDLNLQNTADEYLLKLSNMLPVRYGDVARDEKLYSLLIDVSHSMFQQFYDESKLGIAKAAAKKVVDMLDTTDMLAIIVYYGDAYTLLTPTPALNKDEIKEQIDALKTRQGTVINGGLTMALNLMRDLPYSDKQLLLITDGEDSSGMDNQIYANVDALYSYGIATSVIDVGRGNAALDPDSGSLATAAENRLKNIAELGGGTYWMAEKLDELNTSVFKQISESFGETVIQEYSYVKVARYYDEVLNGVKSNGMISNNQLSYVSGYITSRAKPSATTVLTAEYSKEGGSSMTVPIYSYWNYGNGKASTFTSKISGDWSRKWDNDGIVDALFSDIGRTNIPTQRVSNPYTISVNEQTGYCSLELVPVDLKSQATLTVTVTAPDGEPTELTNVTFDGSMYVSSFVLTAVGRYKIDFIYTYNNMSYSESRYVNVAFLSEYNSFTTFDAAPLYKMLSGYGTVSEDGNLVVKNDESTISLQVLSLAPWLLTSAVVLFAVDVMVRKLKWNDILSLFGKVKKENKQ